MTKFLCKFVRSALVLAAVAVLFPALAKASPLGTYMFPKMFATTATFTGGVTIDTLTVNNAEYHNGAVTNNGALSVGGNTTLGDAPSDTLTLNTSTVVVSATNSKAVSIATSTTDGTSILDVNGPLRSVRADALTVTNGLSVVGAATFVSSATFQSTIMQKNNQVLQFRNAADSSAAADLTSSASNDLRLRIATNEALVIDSSRRVVIGGGTSGTAALLVSTASIGNYAVRVLNTTAGANSPSAMTVGTSFTSTTGTDPVFQATAGGGTIFEVEASSLTLVNGPFQLWARTKAQIDTLVPTRQGQLVSCIDCTTAYNTCESSGTLAAQWRKVGSTTLGCGTGN